MAENEKLEVKTITEWCIHEKLSLLDASYLEDSKQYTIKEFYDLVPRDIQVPLFSEGSTLPNSLDSIAKSFVPEDFAEKYKEMLRQKDEMEKIEKELKSKLIDMFESIPLNETNSVNIDGIKFTYVRSSTRNTVDSKKLQEEYPEIYKSMLKQSDVRSSIRTSVEY